MDAQSIAALVLLVIFFVGIVAAWIVPGLLRRRK